MADRDHRRAFGCHQVSGRDFDRAHFIRPSSVDSHDQLDFSAKYINAIVSIIARMTNTRQGSPARGMFAVDFGLLLAGLNLAMPNLRLGHPHRPCYPFKRFAASLKNSSRAASDRSPRSV